jgi:hypothetical protein
MCGVVVDDVQKHNRTNICCTTFISRTSITAATDNCVGASHMSDNRQMSVAMQRLVDLISMVTN